MRDKPTDKRSWVAAVLVLAALAVFASAPAKTSSVGPATAGIKCTVGADGGLIKCTWD